MKICIFGAGYVGTVTGACLARCGHDITFIEPNLAKVQDINAGISPILEPHLEELIQEGIAAKRLRAIQSVHDELLQTDIAMISVATPSAFNGSLQLEQMRTVLESIKLAVANRKSSLIVSIRSTIHPLALGKLLDDLDLRTFEKMSIVVNPEFLRESTAVSDFFHAPFCVVGGEKGPAEVVSLLYEGLCPKRYIVGIETAGLIKYACNAFHALKIAFTNEMASLCESLNEDPVELMHVFCQDHVLNCSQAYLKPGFSFGGSCLPKDLRALLSMGRELEESLPLLSSILPSNALRFERALAQILRGEHRSVAVIGMSFKKNNDDLRESPFVELIEQLIGKGITVRIYDPDIRLNRLLGSNLKAFTNRFGHLIAHMHEDIHQALNGCDGIVLCKDFCKDEVLTYQHTHSVALYDLQYIITRSHQLQMTQGLECTV